ILAATNVDLQKLVDEDKFREDLYYRLKVVTLDIPPLRERAGDIPLLTTTFIQRYALENGKGPMQITPEALNCLQKYQWPGNVRELQGVLESMVILARGNRLDLENIPLEIRRQVQPGLPLPAPPLPPGNATLADIEKKVILETLEKFQGNRTKTAEALGIGRRTLIRKLHEYGVTKSSEDNES
ncbi:MAG TPA: helix-turn-helix domain-containing protein, partial [bacterium]|nr:helix-turn-helix domain-containing protein [bacterium]